MLEQSTLHGRIFHSEFSSKTLASKPASIGDISFGPMRLIDIYRISDWEFWVQHKKTGEWYYYHGTPETQIHPLAGIFSKNDPKIGIKAGEEHFSYYYGKALHKKSNMEDPLETSYFVQNEPSVNFEGIPDINFMELPLTLQALDYNRIFRYPKEIKQLLAAVPACYVDRYKRPIKRIYGRTYPISMEKVTTTWKDLPETTYPVVIDFSKTNFAVADLEPEHTAEDLKHFDSLSGYYEEETPRGGRHKVIRVEDGRFKFRYSTGLEIINQSQVTLYGINGIWLSDEPEITGVSSYQKVGHVERECTARLERPDVSEEIALLKAKAEENISMAKMTAAKLYAADPDDSHGEFNVLNLLFHQDIKPYARHFSPDLLPWILEGYASDIISHREKHETLRNGVPYLVYLSDIIIGERQAKVWESQKCISSEPVH